MRFAVAESGDYTVTLRLGDREYTHPLRVESRVDDDGSAPFEESWEEWLERMMEGGER